MFFRRSAPLALASACAIGASAMLLAALPAAAQSVASTHQFEIPAGPLAQGLKQLAAAAGITLNFDPAQTAGQQSAALSGSYTAEQALDQLLAGSGLVWRKNAAGAVTLVSTSAPTGDAGDGVVQTGTLSVEGAAATGDSGTSDYTPYETAAPVAHISGQTIERFRGSSPADIFRGTPGVMSGDARNGAGIDVNIRGMQGMGRVVTTVDGAENAINVSHGYQGQATRTYIDPDLIASVDITKGSDVASRGIAGTVEMRTLNAGDVVKSGETFGLRLKAEAGSNTSSPTVDARAGYAYVDRAEPPTASPDGMDRPSLLGLTRGSFSLVAAVKQDQWDFLLGYARRKQGNYHAGSHGPAAEPADIGPQTICEHGVCTEYPVYYDNVGLSNFRLGEEVLNTQMQSTTLLAKGTLRLDDGNSLQLSYTNYSGAAGDVIGSLLGTSMGQAVQQSRPASTQLDTVSLRHRWQPQGSDLIDLRTNLWATDLKRRHIQRFNFNGLPADVGLDEDFMPGMDAHMWGLDVTNAARWSYDNGGALDLTLGASLLSEDTRPSAYTDFLDFWVVLRDGKRKETAAFARVDWKPLDWLSLDAGLRYTRLHAFDRAGIDLALAGVRDALDPHKRDGGFSPSLGLTVDLSDNAQIYAKHSNSLRFPSLVENSTAFSAVINPDIRPEQARSIEVGANLKAQDLLAAGDAAYLKLGYFNWNTKDYIARQWTTYYDDYGDPIGAMQIFNIDRAKFEGLELSTRYESGGFTADLAANYYLDMAYCLEADSCAGSTLYADYATNHAPPKYSINLSLAQKLFDDRLTVGGRAVYSARRAIGHGEITATGASTFIEQIRWESGTLVDMFAEYKLRPGWTASLRVENLTDRYYVDPLSIVNQPGPARTFYVGLTAELGKGDGVLPRLFASDPSRSSIAGSANDWTGLFVGVHGAGVVSDIEGSTTALDGSADPVAASEALRLTQHAPQLGSQIGYNWMFGSGVVAGVIADFGKNYSSGAKTVYEDGITSSVQLQSQTHYQADWNASLRARLGYAFDGGWLLYGSAGVARIKEQFVRDQYRADIAAADVPNGTRTTLFHVERLTTRRNGISVGVGAEYALNDHWSLLADYSYSRFKATQTEFTQARAGTSLPWDETVQTGTTTKPPKFPPGSPQCDTRPRACEPRQVPVYGTLTHPGAFDTQNGRSLANPLGMHVIKIGLNYRF